jgi:hypothetical protein
MLSATNRPEEPRLARRANLRTALTLASIAVVFFGGIVAAQYTGATTVAIGVLGLAIVGFLLVTLLRNVRK